MLKPTFQTMNSILYTPPLDCEDNTFFQSNNKDDFIGKITKEKDIDREIIVYEKVKDLSKQMTAVYGSEKHDYLPFLDFDKIFKCKLSDEIIENLYKNGIFDKYFHHDYQLITPLFKYPDFSVFLLSFRLVTKYFKNYDGYTGINDKTKNIITVSIFKSAMTALYYLYLKLKNFNKFGFYHNDIKSNNIMYNPKTGEMIIIDLADATFEETKNNDLFNLLIIIKELLYVAISNSYIFEEMDQYIRKAEHIQFDQYFKVDINERNNKIYSLIEEIYNKMITLDDIKVVETTNEIELPLEKGKFRQLTYKEQLENSRDFFVKGGKSNSKSKSKVKGRKTRKNKRRSNGKSPR